MEIVFWKDDFQVDKENKYSSLLLDKNYHRFGIIFPTTVI